LLAFVWACLGTHAFAEEQPKILFTNVKVFNGTDRKLYAQDVLVTGNMIELVGEDLPAGDKTTTIDGGGITSITDPLYTVQYSPEEMKTAVETAADFGAYVAVHAYNDTAIIRSVEAGVKDIAHGTLMTEKSAKVMKKNGTWISPSCEVLNLPEGAVAFLSPSSREKFFEAQRGL